MYASVATRRTLLYTSSERSVAAETACTSFSLRCPRRAQWPPQTDIRAALVIPPSLFTYQRACRKLPTPPRFLVGPRPAVWCTWPLHQLHWLPFCLQIAFFSTRTRIRVGRKRRQAQRELRFGIVTALDSWAPCSSFRWACASPRVSRPPLLPSSTHYRPACCI